MATKRIFSLVPSITELVVDLGLEETLVGVTKFCVHPAHLRKQKTVIGGTKNLRLELIQQLQPDLILANKEENERTQVESLAAMFPVYTSEIANFNDALLMIQEVGAATGAGQKAEELISLINQAKSRFEATNLNKFKQYRTLSVSYTHLRAHETHH